MRKSFMQELLYEKGGYGRTEGAADRLQDAFLARFPKGLRLGKVLGCGAIGCVVATSVPGVVVKITKDGTEAAAAHAILKGEIKSPILPKVYQVLTFNRRIYRRGRWNAGESLPQPWFVIVREDLADASEVTKKWWVGCVHTRNFNSYSSARSGVANTGVCANAPANMRKFLDELDELLAAGPDHKVNDLHANNLGANKRGQLKVRDFGWAYWGQKAPFLASLGSLPGTPKLWLAGGLALGSVALLVRAMRGEQR